MSKEIHLLSLEVLLFGNQPDSKLFQHFHQSFLNNYNFKMFMIEEVEEPSANTTIQHSEYFSKNFKTIGRSIS